MSWVSDYKYVWYEKLALNIIRAGGSIPKHVAFVMDGNRRYAESEHLRKIEGHSRGFEKLSDCLRWCMDIGVCEVTTFAFSIENFKRSKEEVDGLLDLAREKFHKLLAEVQELHKHGLRIRVIGNISLLPKDLQKLIARAILETEKNDKLFLNIAFSYTSRDEITQAIEVILKYEGELMAEDINEHLLQECLYTRHSSPPDLLIRTSGETRISDFLMWQISTTVLYFTKILWPQITIWNFLAGIFSYQRTNYRMKRFKRMEQLQQSKTIRNSTFYSDRVQTFLQSLDASRRNTILNLASGN